MDLTRENPLHGDRFYSPIKEATAAILQVGDVVRPIDVLVHLEVITPELVERWRKGGVPYLERGTKTRLRFSKSGEPESEAAYARHYQRTGAK